MDEMVDSVASEGLMILKRLLDGSGFMDSQYLKDYDVLAHVSKRTITYEIVVDMEAVDVTPDRLVELVGKGWKIVPGEEARTVPALPNGKA